MKLRSLVLKKERKREREVRRQGDLTRPTPIIANYPQIKP